VGTGSESLIILFDGEEESKGAYTKRRTGNSSRKLGRSKKTEDGQIISPGAEDGGSTGNVYTVRRKATSSIGGMSSSERIPDDRQEKVSNYLKKAEKSKKRPKRGNNSKNLGKNRRL